MTRTAVSNTSWGQFFAHGLGSVGRTVIQGMSTIVGVLFFVIRTIAAAISGMFYGTQLGQQVVFMAFGSLPLVTLTSVCTGMVLALQTSSAFSALASADLLPQIVTMSLVRELAPVLTGLMMAGRWGSAMTAQLACMRVSDQIDAMVTLSTHPLRYLVVPRVVSAALSLPLLTLVAMMAGVVGGSLVASTHGRMTWGYYIAQTVSMLKPYDVQCGLIKGLCFGLIIGVLGCYEGYYASGGALGVGHATTRGVVRACLLILCMNYVLTATLF